MSERLLIVDDDPEVRYYLREALSADGLDVAEVDNLADARSRLDSGDFDIILLDNRLPDGEGIESIEAFRRAQPDVLILMMTAYGSRNTAVEAIRKGAYDFFTKPIKLEELRVVMSRALERRRLTREVSRLRDQLGSGTSPFRDIVGGSPSMEKVFETMRKVMATDTTVLILGESGTGKELVAQAIHDNSPRSEGPFVKLNCVAIPDNLLESELFGHEKGAFTGAHQRKLGKFELADGGTILLDEIGDMSLATQSKILRVLQEREFERVGGTEPIEVDVRVLASTNRDLREAVGKGGFREDLYFRLNVVSMTLPPLRSRREDISLLAEHFLKEAAARQGKELGGIAPATMDAIESYEWPGNVRQLRHAIERAVIWAEGEQLMPEDLPSEVRTGSLAPSQDSDGSLEDSLPATLERIERKLLVEALRKAGGVQATAARRLGITERSMWHKVKKYDIDVDRLKS